MVAQSDELGIVGRQRSGVFDPEVVGFDQKAPETLFVMVGCSKSNNIAFYTLLRKVAVGLLLGQMLADVLQ